eukprot:scaffold675_cov103-Cylindrotheca_fusiformis.AAC.13
MTSFPKFWEEDEIEEREDGFLFLLRHNNNGWKTEDQQPILLHSTETVLASLYPSSLMEKKDKNCCIVNEVVVGHMGNHREPSLLSDERPDPENPVDEHYGTADPASPGTNGEGRKGILPPEEYHKPYQDLVRNEELARQISFAVEDLRRCRNLVRQEQSAHNHKEPNLVLLIRVLNSIRALCPHLLPILNHPRRNDQDLRIESTKLKKKKCWILGREAYDITNRTQCRGIHNRITLILKGYIDVALAEKISHHILGDPGFWENCWIEELKKRATPRILNPLEILLLSEECDANTIVDVGKQCDQDLLLLDSKKSSSSNDQESYHQAINKLRDGILLLLKTKFPKARLSIYGSCLSNLSLGVGADVDLSLWIPEAEEAKKKFQNGNINQETYRKRLKNYVFQVFGLLGKRKNEFRDMIAITQARVPVVKGTKLNAENPHSPDGSLNFDICFLNDVAVANSNLLREYSLVDPRARSLMMAVKKWTKDMSLNSARDKTISSYAWINLCIFYLQCLGFVPNLQSRKLMKDLGVTADPEGNYWHFVDNLDTFTLKWSKLEEGGSWKQPSEFRNTPVSVLLYGFFEFYSKRFPSALFAISIKQGTIVLPKLASPEVSEFFSIEDPFETYDSHCPHDLGHPAMGKGVRYIFQCLRDAEDHVRDILLGTTKNPTSLWPEPDNAAELVGTSIPIMRKGDKQTKRSESTVPPSKITLEIAVPKPHRNQQPHGKKQPNSNNRRGDRRPNQQQQQQRRARKNRGGRDGGQPTGKRGTTSSESDRKEHITVRKDETGKDSVGKATYRKKKDSFQESKQQKKNYRPGKRNKPKRTSTAVGNNNTKEESKT